jgi:CDP-diacylglycerol--serine O-phosphatidyltransferase
MNLTRHIPNALTSGNLLCGMLGLVSVLNNYPVEPAWFIWAACAFDFLDGFVARWLRVNSPMGRELDSLADVVSFGVLPSITMFQWINALVTTRSLAYLAMTIAVFSALRLAKFNIDTRQHDVFIGLPTPANALFITSLSFLPEPLYPFVFTGPVLVVITLVFSLLLVAPVELFALKFKNFRWTGNKLRFTFLAISVFLLAVFQVGALAFIILLYIILSLVSRVLRLKE